MESSPTPDSRLDPRVKTAWRLQALTGLAPLALGAVVLSVVSASLGLPRWVPALALGVIVVLAVVSLGISPGLRYRRWRWKVAEEEVRLQEGLIVVSQTVIPMVRIQHVDTSQGPIMRALGLSDVQIWTAAGKHTIPALADEQAAQLRDRIALLARVSDDGGL